MGLRCTIIKYIIIATVSYRVLEIRASYYLRHSSCFCMLFSNYHGGFLLRLNHRESRFFIMLLGYTPVSPGVRPENF